MKKIEKLPCTGRVVSCKECGRLVVDKVIPDSPWISVKKRLPEDSQKIIFSTLIGDMEYHLFCGIFAKRWKDTRDIVFKNVFIENFECHPFNLDDVTHWMPLPEGPNE